MDVEGSHPIRINIRDYRAEILRPKPKMPFLKKNNS